MATDVDVQEGDVLAEETGLTPELLTLPALLHAIEVMAGQFPGAPQLLLDGQGLAGERLFRRLPVMLEFPGGTTLEEPLIQRRIIRLIPGLKIGFAEHRTGFEQQGHELVIPVGRRHD